MYIQIRKVIIRKLLRESLGKTLNWCTNLFIDAIAISPSVFNHCIWRAVLNSLGYINNLAMLIPLHMEKVFALNILFHSKSISLLLKLLIFVLKTVFIGLCIIMSYRHYIFFISGAKDDKGIKIIHYTILDEKAGVILFLLC